MGSSRSERRVYRSIYTLTVYFCNEVACLSTEMRKTVADADGEVMRGIDSVQSACSIGHEMVGTCNMSEPTQSYTLYEPLVFNIEFRLLLYTLSEKLRKLTSFLLNRFREFACLYRRSTFPS